MSIDTLGMVREFHEAFGIEVGPEPGIPDEDMSNADKVSLANLGEQLRQISTIIVRSEEEGGGVIPFLRTHLILEELSELVTAMAEGDLPGCLDALCDLRYVCDGAVLSLGLQDVFAAGFEEVHRTNLAKLGYDGQPIKNSAGRIIKPEGWHPPDFRHLLKS